MTKNELDILVAQGEGQRIEFKEDAIKPGDLAQSFVALANADGGVVLIGVSDLGVAVGLASAKRAFDLVMTAASHELCDPPITLSTVESVAAAPGVQVLVATVARSRQLHSTHGRFLIRRGSHNVSLTTAEVWERAHRLDSDALTPLTLGKGLQALYEVLSFDSTLEIGDSRGELATLSGQETIRLLQDGVVGFYDRAWGDGELFAEYAVEPGVVADRFQIGPRHITLISLREIKNRGDLLRLQVRRQIRGGWTRDEEWLETVVSHRTRFLRTRVIFPVDRPPIKASLTDESTGITRDLSRRSWRHPEDGRVVLVWQSRSIKVGETYLLRWRW